MQTRFVLLFFVFQGCFLSALAQQTLIEKSSDSVLNKFIQLARDRYPKLKTYDAQIRIAEMNVTKAKFGWGDLFNFSYYRTQNFSGTINNSYLLNGYQYGISLNIGSILQKPGTVKAAREALFISQLDKQTYDLTLVKEVKQRYYIYLQQQANLRLVAQAVLDAQNNLRSISQKFEKGQETFENYNIALMSSTAQSQAKLAAEANFLIAKSELEEMIGTKVEYVR